MKFTYISQEELMYIISSQWRQYWYQAYYQHRRNYFVPHDCRIFRIVAENFSVSQMQRICNLTYTDACARPIAEIAELHLPFFPLFFLGLIMYSFCFKYNECSRMHSYKKNTEQKKLKIRVFLFFTTLKCI